MSMFTYAQAAARAEYHAQAALTRSSADGAKESGRLAATWARYALELLERKGLRS